MPAMMAAFTHMNSASGSHAHGEPAASGQSAGSGGRTLAASMDQGPEDRGEGAARAGVASSVSTSMAASARLPTPR